MGVSTYKNEQRMTAVSDAIADLKQVTVRFHHSGLTMFDELESFHEIHRVTTTLNDLAIRACCDSEMFPIVNKALATCHEMQDVINKNSVFLRA